MTIRGIKIKKLFGYLDKDISFNENITLLVGINGSGKTSILNLINWILKPSINNLCITNFKEIILSLTFRNEDYTIKCTHQIKKFKYEVSSKTKKYKPLTVNLKHKFAEAYDENIISLYQDLGPDESELDTWNLISSFDKPIIIGLDRNIYTEISDRIYLENSKIRDNRINKSVIQKISPISNVKDLINKEYRIKKNKILDLTKKLKNQIMLSAFEGVVNQNSLLPSNSYKIHVNQINITENRVNNYFENFEKTSFDNDDLKIITNYFNNLRNIIEQYENDPNNNLISILYKLNANQFTKIIRMLKEFENFEKTSKQALLKINTFIDTINFFLKDSSKEMIFKEETSEIFFNTLDKNGNTLTKFNDIRYLSSGEQQILVLFAYIAFSDDIGKIFIIDEPELSLHIRWQENFIEQIEKITKLEKTNKNIQLILATHSPILANKKKKEAIVLTPY